MSRGRGESKTSQRRIAAALKRRQALELRIQGHTLDEIAKRLGFAGRSGVSDTINAALNDVVAKPAAELRNLEAERLDRLRKAWWARAKKSEKALACYLRISERYARLLGLDAPTKLAGPDGKDLNFTLDISGAQRGNGPA